MPDTPKKKTKNRGELAEIYVFLKLLLEGKLQLTDEASGTVKKAFLDILSIVREENEGNVFRYIPVDADNKVKIKLNNALIDEVPKEEFIKWLGIVWRGISHEGTGGTDDAEIKEFLNSIYISNISSPSFNKTQFFGGVIDIFVETQKDGVVADIGFSVKSDLKSPATCFNASGDNTNFEYRLVGNMTDELMDKFNNTWSVKKDGTLKITPKKHFECDMIGRMALLKDNDIDLEFVTPVKKTAATNLIMSGGMEFPTIIGAMLKYFYYEKACSNLYINETIDWLVGNNPAGYPISDKDVLRNMYEAKIKKFLYDVSMGLRFGSIWTGSHDVSGGYIVVHNSGTVTAYHTTVEDNFKEFLFRRLQMEKPSSDRHQFMEIYKKGSEYFVKLNLQCRFNLEKE